MTCLVCAEDELSSCFLPTSTSNVLTCLRLQSWRHTCHALLGSPATPQLGSPASTLSRRVPALSQQGLQRHTPHWLQPSCSMSLLGPHLWTRPCLTRCHTCWRAHMTPSTVADCWAGCWGTSQLPAVLPAPPPRPPQGSEHTASGPHCSQPFWSRWRCMGRCCQQHRHAWLGCALMTPILLPKQQHHPQHLLHHLRSTTTTPPTPHAASPLARARWAMTGGHGRELIVFANLAFQTLH
jgi:hypothetical protein